MKGIFKVVLETKEITTNSGETKRVKNLVVRNVFNDNVAEISLLNIAFNDSRLFNKSIGKNVILLDKKFESNMLEELRTSKMTHKILAARKSDEEKFITRTINGKDETFTKKLFYFDLKNLETGEIVENVVDDFIYDPTLKADINKIYEGVEDSYYIVKNKKSKYYVKETDENYKKSSFYCVKRTNDEIELKVGQGKTETFNINDVEKVKSTIRLVKWISNPLKTMLTGLYAE